MEDKYYIYILRCEDGSLYTGIAKNYEDRYQKHIDGTGARYTKARKPIRVEKVWATDGRSAASKIEYFLKKYSKKNKEKFIEEEIFAEIVKEKLELEVVTIK